LIEPFEQGVNNKTFAKVGSIWVSKAAFDRLYVTECLVAWLGSRNLLSKYQVHKYSQKYSRKSRLSTFRHSN
jgi:hypothetical protein